MWVKEGKANIFWPITKYASVEKENHREYKNKAVVGAGDPTRRSGITLAAWPIAKSFGVTTTAEREMPGSRYYASSYATLHRCFFDDYSDLWGIYDLVEVFSIDEQFSVIRSPLHWKSRNE